MHVRAREKRILVVASAVSLVSLIVIAYFVIAPSGVLTFRGHFSDYFGNAEEGIGLEVGVGGWAPVGPIAKLWALLGDSFWIIDGTKYSTVSATLKVKVTYKGIKPYSLNVTILEFWCSYGTAKSYLINADPVNGINGANTDGTWDRYNSNPFTGSKSVDTIGSELSLPQDGSTVTVYYKYRVQVKGYGAKSGQLYTADTNELSPSPSSGSWQWYTESASSPSTSGSVSYSSWVDLALGAALGVTVAFLFVRVSRRRSRR